jgi:Tol biopolymer transport system component
MNTPCILMGTFSLVLVMNIQAADSLGIFSHQNDIGHVGHAGSCDFDSGSGKYSISGGGANMWFTNDAFHYVWKRASGDISVSADIRWPATNGVAHRKACLVIRQTLDSDAVYADAAIHGNGLTSVQYRDGPGETTREIEASLTAPTRVTLEKRGDYVSLSAGGNIRIHFQDPFYIGLAVCAHDDDALATAEFSDVEVAALPPLVEKTGAGRSTLEVVSIASKDRRIIYQTAEHIEAPNWSRDGTYFIFNSKGRLFRLPVEGGEPQMIETGFAIRCNNDHGISPDGTQLAISDQSHGEKSLVYTVPITGGDPHLITPIGPSYWHGWSPDGKTLAFCGQRDGEFDVYTVPADGGAETRLTTAPGLDDGPDYSPDGKYIYFNSVRTGIMQIWRMNPDGSGQEQITSDDYNNWFAHPSPDGKWIVFLSYSKDVTGHPANHDVVLRLKPTNGEKIEVLAKLFGGQGTMNVPSWSPDSKQVAFVSYQPGYR